MLVSPPTYIEISASLLHFLNTHTFWSLILIIGNRECDWFKAANISGLFLLSQALFVWLIYLSVLMDTGVLFHVFWRNKYIVRGQLLTILAPVKFLICLEG